MTSLESAISFLFPFCVILALVLFLILLIYYMILRLPAVFYTGAIFMPTPDEEVVTIISLLGIQLGEKAIDLGSGDGKLVIALAKAGAKVEGYEINPFLVWVSRRNIKKAGLTDNAVIYQKDFWEIDFSPFSIVTLYGVPYIMNKLEAKLKKELKPGARVASNYFGFSSWAPLQKEKNVYLYIK